MDISEIVAGSDAIKTALGLAKSIQARDLANALQNMREAALREQAVLELQHAILAAEAEQKVLLETIEALQNEVAELKAGPADRERSRLSKTG